MGCPRSLPCMGEPTEQSASGSGKRLETASCSPFIKPPRTEILVERSLRVDHHGAARWLPNRQNHLVSEQFRCMMELHDGVRRCRLDGAYRHGPGCGPQ